MYARCESSRFLLLSAVSIEVVCDHAFPQIPVSYISLKYSPFAISCKSCHLSIYRSSLYRLCSLFLLIMSSIYTVSVKSSETYFLLLIPRMRSFLFPLSLKLPRWSYIRDIVFSETFCRTIFVLLLVSSVWGLSSILHRRPDIIQHSSTVFCVINGIYRVL